MTKLEYSCFDSMVRKIIHDSRKQLSYYKEGKSGTKYVMVPLTDVLRELNIFIDTLEPFKKKN